MTMATAATTADEAMEAWTEALDQFELRLDQFRAVLEPDGEPPVGMWPPSGLLEYPLPEGLADRVRYLLDRARIIEAELIARRTELPPPQRPAARHRRRPSASTVYTAL